MVQEDRSADGETLSLDACLELLANRQRRTMVRFFLENGTDHAPVDELITAIIDEEEAKTGERPGHDSIASALFHIHLPKFADAAILDYDTRNLDVRYRGDPQVEAVYAKIREIEAV